MTETLAPFNGKKKELVVIALPLSNDAQHQTVKGYMRGHTISNIIRTIGRPVPAGDLTQIGNIVWFKNDPEPVLGSYLPAVFKKGSVTSVTSLDDATAMIAKRDAEIARLKDALRGIIDTAHNLPEFMRIESMQKEAEEALKGPEA